jgi:hydrogenase expression/formation protein HypE
METRVDRREKIKLAHGSGGTLMHELIDELIVPAVGNPILRELEDSAEIADLGGRRVEGGTIALTTDSYVVQPLFFPGGDIGTLAVAGTVNDLAVKGARPLYITLGLVVEEGLPVADLANVLASIAKTAETAGVAVAAGDTKVVEHGAVGGLIVNTSGLGVIPEGCEISARRVTEGDAVVVSGTIGDHETAIVVAREDLRLEETIESDCAPLADLIGSVLAVCPDVHVMRDPTRGGLGTTLNEIADKSGVGIEIEEAAIPIDRKVRAVCEILGFDPIYMANEGKVIVVAPAPAAGDIVNAMRRHRLGRNAAVIGKAGGRPGVHLRTTVGGLRPVLMLEGVQLPRIC